MQRRKDSPILRCYALAVFCVGLLSLTAISSAQKIYTVAGGYVGDGNMATSAGVNHPRFAAFDASGNLYISDTLNCRIRRVDAVSGVISTVAGTGICGYSGDGGKATGAKISFPLGVVVDAQNNVFFGDAFNFRVRRLDSSGSISTIAGNGKPGYCGDGGLAVKACVGFPWALAISGSDLYIADTNNCRIRRVSGGVISTVAGNGTCDYAGDGGLATKASLNSPEGVAIYGLPGSQTLWISDSYNSVIRKVDMNSGIITTFWGDGACGYPLQQLCFPEGIVVDANGDLFVADTNNQRVLAWENGTGYIVLEAGGQGQGFNGDGYLGTSTMLNFPTDVAVDTAGNLLIVDDGNDRIRKGSAFQLVTTVAGGYIGDGGQGLLSSLNSYRMGSQASSGIAFDPQGNLYVADTDNNRVRKVSTAGVITTIAGTGITGYTGDGGPASNATLSFPSGVVVDQHGNVFIADTGNLVVRKVDSSGTITTFAGLFHPYGLAVDTSGNIYAADANSCVVWEITPSGSSSIVAGVQNQCGYNSDNIPATQALLFRPVGVGVDSAGNFYIADHNNYRVREVNKLGIIETVVGNGTCGSNGDGGLATLAEVCTVTGVTFDAVGNMYVADYGYGHVRIVNTSGIIQTLAGSLGFYNGDGLPALRTNMTPLAIAINPSGVAHVLDGGSARVRKIETVTQTILSSSQNPSQQGQSVTFTAVVTGSTGANPTGSVTFKAGKKSLGKFALRGGKASVETSALPKGSTTITATFNGGTDFTQSASSLVQVVN